MKTYKLFTILSIFLIFSFTSCYDPVFFEIRKDVPPEPASFECPITSLVRYSVQDKEYLVTATNEGISYKDATNAIHGSWKKINSLPFELHHYDNFNSTHVGEHIIHVCADNSTLYVCTAEYESDDSLGITKISKICLWAVQNTLSEDGITWSDNAAVWKCLIEDTDNTYFPIYLYDEYYHSAFNIISTNAPIKEHRKVYIRRGNLESQDFNTITYYELTGLNAPVKIEPLNFIDSTEKNCANSALYFNDSVYFFNSPATISNETYSTNPTRFYYSNGNDVYSNVTDNALETVKKVNAGNKVSSIAFCTDALLIARANYENTSTSSYEGGIVKAVISNGELSTELSKFTTNAEFQLPNTYFVPLVLNATPDHTETTSYLYASTIIFGMDASSAASYKNVGLWSYYPDRGNWNRE